MHATIVSTYPPRACGLATFSRDQRAGLNTAGCVFKTFLIPLHFGVPAGRL